PARRLSTGLQSNRGWSDHRRALATRLIAGTVAAALLAVTGGQDPDQLLVLSQVILSLALPFALGPLVVLACRKPLMGRHALRGAWAWAAVIATVGIILLDGYLLVDMVV
ncbi:manganese transporter, partial [Achromobacter ruhlandii]